MYEIAPYIFLFVGVGSLTAAVAVLVAPKGYFPGIVLPGSMVLLAVGLYYMFAAVYAFDINDKYPAELRTAEANVLSEINSNYSSNKVNTYNIIVASCEIYTSSPRRCTEDLSKLYIDDKV